MHDFSLWRDLEDAVEDAEEVATFKGVKTVATPLLSAQKVRDRLQRSA